MNMQQLRRRHVAATAHRLARDKADQEFSEYMHAQAALHDYWQDDDDPWNRPATTCTHCSGTGGDPWNDGITPCEHCDGEGYEWWK